MRRQVHRAHTPHRHQSNHVHGTRGGLRASATFSRRSRALWSQVLTCALWRSRPAVGADHAPSPAPICRAKRRTAKAHPLTKPRHDCLRRYARRNLEYHFNGGQIGEDLYRRGPSLAKPLTCPTRKSSICTNAPTKSTAGNCLSKTARPTRISHTIDLCPLE